MQECIRAPPKQGRYWEISRAEFWWSRDILSSSICLQEVDQKILPCGQGGIDSVKTDPSLLMMREWSFSPRRSWEFMWHLKQLNLSSTQTQPLIPQSTPTHACAQWKWIFGNFMIQCSSPLAKFARSSQAKEIDSKDCEMIKKRERKRTLSSTSLGARIQWRVSPPSMNHFDNWKFWSSNDGKTYCSQVCFRSSCTWWWLKVRGWSLVMTNGRRRKRLMIRRWNGPVRCDPLVTLITLVRMRLSARK